MTKNEFILRLTEALRRQNVADADDVIAEYQQHFAFKLADGYSEEKIAARLGDPAALAAQFAQSGAPEKKSARKPLLAAGLGLADLFAGMFFLLLIAWGVVMAAAALASGTLTVCLVGGLSIGSLIPPIPLLVRRGDGLCLCRLGSTAGCVYYAAFVRQLMRSFGRFQHNALAEASGRAALPALAIFPQFSARARRRLRSTALIALALFAACFVLGYIACSLSAGTLQFWHAWGWFGYAG